ncbi:MAG TPA: hypothetical protein VJ597_05160 [Sphingomicrobium sp.]|nr:hypothetical protein [Sphingomicrobium sp.]
MRLSTWMKGLCVPVALLCAASAGAAEIDDTLKAIQQQIDTLKQQGKYTVNEGSLAIESWLLTSTAIDSTAIAMKKSIDVARATNPKRPILVVSGTEPLDFSQVEMLQLEIDALTDRFRRLSDRGAVGIAEVSSVPALAGALIGLLKSDVQLEAIKQEVPAALLAAAVANRLDNAFLPSAAIAAEGDAKLIRSFKDLMDAADEAQQEAAADEQEELKALLARYDALTTRLLTPNAIGVAPLAFAARLQKLMQDDPYVLRVNTEKAGGTLLKRTNVVTALGGESVFVSGGLVSSYQLTDPRTGKMIGAGVVTCRTTLTSLKRVQEASWKAQASMRTTDGRIEPAAICSP